MEMPSLGGASGWLNSPPLTAAGLRGKVVLIEFWTYTCINWLRQLPYVRAWAEKYKDQGLVVDAAGRLAHVGATAELERVAEEVAQIVKVMSGLIHIRFAGQPELLAAWESASNVVAAPKPEEKPDVGPPTGGEVRPAA